MLKLNPPKRALQFLRWFCREDCLDEIEGDLMEIFQKESELSPSTARRIFMFRVLRYFRPEFVKSFKGNYINNTTPMFRHNLLIAYRNFLRHKSAFLINLTGLSTALACAVLIYLWVADELSINKFHDKDGQLYQVMNNIASAQEILTYSITPVPLARALSEEMPEVEYAVAVNDFFNWQTAEGTFSAGDTHVLAEGWHAGKDFFNVFSYDLAEGDKNQVLSDKNNVVISEALAMKLFHGTDGVVGKMLKWKHPFFEGMFQVSGIFKSPPPNSSAKFDFLFSIDVLLDHDRWAKRWTGNNAETYLVLRPGTNIEEFNRKIAGFVKSKDPLNKNFTLFVQHYSSRYLYGHYENGVQAGGRIEYVMLFSIVAVFILLIACVNFMNLSTAKASLKMKEIGVKKTIGAPRKALITQFLTESLLTTLLSLVIAILLVALLLPQFNEITRKHLSFSFEPHQISILAAIIFFTGLFAGSYPAFYLSGFRPLSVLKGKLNASTDAVLVRRWLVVFQFAMSVIFITGIVIVNEQIEFTKTKNLGYNRDNILCFQWKGELYTIWDGLNEGKSNERFETFMRGLKEIPGVVNATNMTGSILNKIAGQSGISWRGQETDRDYIFQSPIVGYDFIETLGIELKEGRSFSKDRHDDYSKVILNEAAVELMELKDPVGKIIDLNGGSEIVGVAKDFHYGSLHNAVEPLIFRCLFGRNIMVRMEAGTEQNTIEHLRKFHKQFLPEHPFEFTFMDDDYQALYESETKVASLSQYFSVIAIVISCLGLFGLASFTAQRKQQEIGIRKILGASELNIIGLLSAEFTKMVFIAIIIAIPVSYFIGLTWLNTFASRIELKWWFFAGAGLSALLIAWFTVGLLTIKASRVNPTECLRSE